MSTIWQDYLNKVKTVSSLFLLMICFISCDAFDRKHLNETIIFPQLSQIQGFNMSSATIQDFEIPKLVVYYGADECSSCAVKSLSSKIKFIEELSSKVRIIFLMSPSPMSEKHVERMISLYDFGFPIYIDNDNLFAKLNPIVTKGVKYHCLLLNNTNQILFYSNPGHVFNNPEIVLEYLLESK